MCSFGFDRRSDGESDAGRQTSRALVELFARTDRQESDLGIPIPSLYKHRRFGQIAL